jgi:type VI secretion system secreted protein VgrG
VDKHGRIKVQFHWDRYGKADDQSSCFVRVAQSWAGKSWGALFHPRIGQEVVVDFLEGDPDRPIVTGSVYNGDNAPPYALPGEKTRGGIKSRSTAGGAAANCNEIRIEDKKGAEEILIHAERNLTVETEQHEERSATSRTTAIKGNDQLTVKSNRTIEVSEGDQTTTIKQGRMVTDVSVGESKLHARKIVVEADESITLEVQGNTIKIGPAGISINGQALVEIKGGIVKLN